MTAKLKAEDIWMKCFQKQIEITGNGDGSLCIEMALIAVDEILTINDERPYMLSGFKETFYKEVKIEIEKL
jgi:hypothetical protein